MDDVSVRAGTPADADAIQRVARAAWHAAYDTVLDAETIDETVDAWYDPEQLVDDDVEPPERVLSVATTDGTVVGFAEAVPDPDDDGLAHLYRIYVTPDAWGNGIGSALLARVGARLDDRGFDRLAVSVVAENEVGVGFYESRGFRRTATTYNDRWETEEYEYRTHL